MAGPRRSIVWSREAESDLEDIWTYYAENAGREVANTIVRAIGDTCRILEDHPLAGRGRDEIRLGLRSALSSPYVIFYRIRGNAPEIVRVLDGRRDIDEIFSDEPQQSSSEDG
jgi:toxin ParE1/3/4